MPQRSGPSTTSSAAQRGISTDEALGVKHARCATVGGPHQGLLVQPLTCMALAKEQRSSRRRGRPGPGGAYIVASSVPVEAAGARPRTAWWGRALQRHVEDRRPDGDQVPFGAPKASTPVMTTMPIQKYRPAGDTTAAARRGSQDPRRRGRSPRRAPHRQHLDPASRNSSAHGDSRDARRIAATSAHAIFLVDHVRQLYHQERLGQAAVTFAAPRRTAPGPHRRAARASRRRRR